MADELNNAGQGQSKQGKHGKGKGKKGKGERPLKALGEGKQGKLRRERQAKRKEREAAKQAAGKEGKLAKKQARKQLPAEQQLSRHQSQINLLRQQVQLLHRQLQKVRGKGPKVKGPKAGPNSGAIIKFVANFPAKTPDSVKVDVEYNPDTGPSKTIHLSPRDSLSAERAGNEKSAMWVASTNDKRYTIKGDTSGTIDIKNAKGMYSTTIDVVENTKEVDFTAKFPADTPDTVEVSVEYNPNKGKTIHFPLTAYNKGAVVTVGTETTAKYTATLTGTGSELYHIKKADENGNLILNKDATAVKIEVLEGNATAAEAEYEG